MQIEQIGRKQLVAKKLLTFSHCSQPHADHPERNEDTVLLDRKRGMAAVFDGVGGVAHGDRASRTAARVLRSGWRRRLAAVQQKVDLLRGEQQIDIPLVMNELLYDANECIRAQGERQVQEDGTEKIVCGETTVVFVVFSVDVEAQAYVLHYAHVGDSRIYVLSLEKGLRRLTEDDGYFTREVGKSVLSEQDALRIEQTFAADQLTEEERAHYEKRNGITQALGYKELRIHVGQVVLLSGDRVLLCSDGIHDNLTDLEIEEIVRKGARTTVAQTLLSKAIKRSQEEHLRAKKDDMSCVVVTCL